MTTKEKLLLFLLPAALVLAGAAYRLLAPPPVVVGEFVPPPFEENALPGAPEDLDPALGYGPLSLDEGFQVALCGAPEAREDALALYLTSLPDNTVWVRARVLDGEGGTLGESGLLRPGEYLPDLPLTRPLPKDGQVTVKLLSYEPETYYSRGSAGVKLAVTGP